MLKTKSRSVSNEVVICMSVIENSWPAPQAILGAELAPLLTDPWMHLLWKACRLNSDLLVKALLQENPEKSKPPKLVNPPVGNPCQLKPPC